MKRPTNRLWRILALLLAFSLIAAACGDDDDASDDDTPATVLELAVEAGQFSTLVAAIEAADLAATLEGEGPFTVLAPTDAAFEAAFTALGITAEELLADTATLTAILTYHVLPQEADSQLIATLDGQSVATVNGDSVAISVVDGDIMVDQATVVSADLEADNGIVHVINAVLLPEDIAAALGAAAPADDDMADDDMTEEEATTTTVADDEAAAAPDLEGRTVTVGVENAYLPFNYVPVGGTEGEGWDYDAWNEICRLVNCQAEFVAAGWPDVIDQVAQGEIDTAADGISITDERKEVVAFSRGLHDGRAEVHRRPSTTTATAAPTTSSTATPSSATQVGTTNYELAAELVGGTSASAHSTSSVSPSRRSSTAMSMP